ncbi:hypothetical protein U8527_21335 [Kordia algicida OT-1]|uniref:Uncharacterized protein n=1 Tax=Kordia algicida OT-1 TaxID=391587 RepID=A9DLF5_9FLAO|nr:hypothetical protein [Kordia algicida]EDP98556.1 hypothetical protein KAOT1_15102 [Kordia algicida OT-1]
MRENKKVLKFRKFKIANLQIKGIVGGTDSNPCHNTNTNPGDQSQVNCDQTIQSFPNECTVFHGRTDLRNGCTDPDSVADTNNTGQVSG